MNCIFHFLFSRSKVKIPKYYDSAFAFYFSFLLKYVGCIGFESNGSLSVSFPFLSPLFSMFSSSLIRNPNIDSQDLSFQTTFNHNLLTPNELPHKAVHGNPKPKFPPNQPLTTITKPNPSYPLRHSQNT
jgi:hypothetical protein